MTAALRALLAVYSFHPHTLRSHSGLLFLAKQESEISRKAYFSVTVSGGRGHTYSRLTLSRGGDPVMGDPRPITGHPQDKTEVPWEGELLPQTARWLLPGSCRPLGFTPAGPHDHLSQFLKGNILLWLMGCFSGDPNTFRTRRSCQAFQVSAPGEGGV